ncbi:MAG: nucleoside 2-deoxyribosyltransferase [Ruminococcaceae bacterium]|nr:nucleoside 2-deoxyribosyltransferase [Oscillospiraceae bacterium]
MITSAKLQEMIVGFLSDKENHSVQEIKAFLAQSGVDDYTEGQFAGSINTLLRNGSIKKLDRGVYAIGKRSEDMRKCFVVCPIGEEGTEVRTNSDKLLKYIIAPVCEMCGFEAERIDKRNDANSITQSIIEALDNADLVIADITGHNPNVFYEMGYRARTKKPMIHLRRKGENLPFDITAIRTFEYDLTDLDSVEEIKDRLKKTIESFQYNEPTNEETQEDVLPENAHSAIMPLLYQILDTMGELKNEVKNFSTETIGTVIKSMQPTQPQVSPDTALQMQLISGLMQNPDGFMKLVEISDKLNKGKK